MNALDSPLCSSHHPPVLSTSAPLPALRIQFPFEFQQSIVQHIFIAIQNRPHLHIGNKFVDYENLTTEWVERFTLQRVADLSVTSGGTRWRWLGGLGHVYLPLTGVLLPLKTNQMTIHFEKCFHKHFNQISSWRMNGPAGWRRHLVWECGAHLVTCLPPTPLTHPPTGQFKMFQN